MGKFRHNQRPPGREAQSTARGAVYQYKGSGSYMKKVFSISALSLAMLLLFLLPVAEAKSTPKSRKGASGKITENATAKKKMAKLRSTRKSTSRSRRGKLRRARYVERFYTSSYASDQTTRDAYAGEDPVVRAAAVEALGNMNGTVVVIDPNTGRILAMVNQDLALSEGAQPCSTIKVAVGMAALSEGIVTKDTPVQLSRRWKMDLTQAMAMSNNPYFEVLGRRLGFEKVAYYANMFGLGELAGYNIEGEHLGTFPTEELSAKLGGVGRMCSFGESISMTPLQLGAMVSAIANGGTLYYLQHPKTPEEVLNFQPRIKRQLNIAHVIPEIAEGMMGAVEYGTGRAVRLNFGEEQVLGKTGTCSKDGTRFGWFASYANTQYGRIVTVVFLRGGRPTYGPKAAEIAGRLYRSLYDHSYFVARTGRDSEGRSAGASQ